MTGTHEINKIAVVPFLAELKRKLLEVSSQRAAFTSPSHTSKDIPFKSKPVAAGLVLMRLWGSVSSQSEGLAGGLEAWLTNMLHRQTNRPCWGLMGLLSRAESESASTVALSSLCHSLFPKHDLVVNYINLQARAWKFRWASAQVHV